jgi:uncharacterized protein (TIGR02679 family)
MSTVDTERLRRLLGGADTRWVLDRVRSRIERGRPLTGPISLPTATPAQRRAIETLLGRAPSSGRSLTVSLNELDAVIRRSGAHADGIGAAVIALTGPVVVHAEARALLADAWELALAPLAAVAARRPGLSPWFEHATARGLFKRLCGTPERAVPIIASAARLLDVLPLSGSPLSQVAHEAAGDTHALDHSRPLATVALSAIRHTWWPGAVATDSPAQLRRALWDSVGVATDELSSTALALNLPVGDTAPGLAQILHIAGELGEPIVLTLRQLARQRVTFAPAPVFICENPAVVLAAANAMAANCPALVCVNGQPTGAVLRLLSLLDGVGCTLLYHGDFDWGGIRIANLLWHRYSLRPWRFDAQSYRDRLYCGSGALRGTPAVALWDADLSAAIERHGIRVEEEAVLPDLLSDLAGSAQ